MTTPSQSTHYRADDASQSDLWLLRVPRAVEHAWKATMEAHVAATAAAAAAAAASDSSSSKSSSSMRAPALLPPPPPLGYVHVLRYADGRREVRFSYEPQHAHVAKRFVVEPSLARPLILFRESTAEAAAAAAAAATAATSSSSTSLSSLSSASASSNSSPAVVTCPMVGRVGFEGNAVPDARDPETTRALAAKRREAANSISQTVFADDPETEAMLLASANAALNRRSLGAAGAAGATAASASATKLSGTKRSKQDADKAPVKEKRVRGDLGDVRRMILEAFHQREADPNTIVSAEGHVYLSIDELQRATDQPRDYLIDVLKDLCERETRGPFMHKYRLNETYWSRRSG